jgi:hypothetical protein
MRKCRCQQSSCESAPRDSSEGARQAQWTLEPTSKYPRHWLRNRCFLSILKDTGCNFEKHKKPSINDGINSQLNGYYYLNVHPYVPEKIIGTLTLSILKSMHTSISLVMFRELYSIATPRYSKPLPLENHVRIVALKPDLQRVPFYSTIEFLHYTSTTELLPSLIYTKGSHPSSLASPLYRRSLSALWLL